MKPGGVDADTIVEGTAVIRVPPQLASVPRHPVLLRPTDTALGITSHQLVLNPDVLIPGRAYFAKVSAFHKRMSSQYLL